MTKKKEVIYTLVGPTCTFKSTLAIQLAKKYPFEIISADSRLVYKGMDVGTSKPTVKDRDAVKHYMIDLIEPNEDYSVALYKKEAENKINEIFSREKIPFLVGGTGLYLNSVLHGLSIPEVKPDKGFRDQLKDFTQEELYERLKNLDPKACEIIHKNDNFRTVRALEVIYKTNKLFSNLKTFRKLPFQVIWIGLTYEDKDLHTRGIKRRTEAFCKDGFIDEVKLLLKKYGELELFKRTIGYKDAIDYLANKINKEKMIENIALRTKQFAKRQMTWFRGNKDIHWIYLDKINFDKTLSSVRHYLS